MLRKGSRRRRRDRRFGYSNTWYIQARIQPAARQFPDCEIGRGRRASGWRCCRCCCISFPVPRRYPVELSWGEVTCVCFFLLLFQSHAVAGINNPVGFLLREGGFEDADWNWTGFVVGRICMPPKKGVGGRLKGGPRFGLRLGFKHRVVEGRS